MTAMKTWIVLLLLSVAFTLVGVGLLVGGILSGTWPLVVVGAVFGVLGLGLGAAVVPIRREQAVGGELLPVTPATEEAPTASEQDPWPWEVLRAEVARAFADTPFTVLADDDRLRVRADLADTRFLTATGVRRLQHVEAVDLVRKGRGRAVGVDSMLALEWHAGVGSDLQPRLRGSASVMSGKRWTWSKRVEVGVGDDGRLGRQVDWSFRSADIKEPLGRTLQLGGWQQAWSTEAKLGLAVAALGASSVVVVPVAFLVRWLAGG